LRESFSLIFAELGLHSIIFDARKECFRQAFPEVLSPVKTNSPSGKCWQNEAKLSKTQRSGSQWLCL